MNNLLKKITAVSLTAALFAGGNAIVPVIPETSYVSAADEVSDDNSTKKGKCGSYDYEYWKDGDGTIDTQFREDGGFDFTWEDVYSALCMTGRIFEENDPDRDGKPVITYKTASEGGCYTIGAQCYFSINKSLFIDFSVIDDWGGIERDDMIPKTDPSFKQLTTLEVDGGVYDIYKYNRTGFVDGTGQNIVRIVSIRREKTSSGNGEAEGTISVYKHIEACKAAGEKLSSPLCVTLMADAWRGTGSVHVLKNDISFDGDAETTTAPDRCTKGDANVDDNVNIADAVLVMQVATNPDVYGIGKTERSITAQGAENADVDGVPGLTNSDALLIQKYKLGLIDEF